jgi:hypothetical protein
MIQPQVLHRKSLFARLYQIDQDLSKQTQAKGCPIAGGGCIAPIIIENLEALPVILMRNMNFVLACAAAVPGAVGACCRLRCDFGDGGCIGHQWYCW